MSKYGEFNKSIEVNYRDRIHLEEGYATDLKITLTNSDGENEVIVDHVYLDKNHIIELRDQLNKLLKTL